MKKPDSEILEFKKHLASENKNTVRKYALYLGRIKTLTHKPLKEITRDDLKALLVRLKEKGVVGASTFNSYITAARAYFYHYLRRNFPSPRDKTFRQKVVYDDERVLDKEEQKLLFAALKPEPNPLYKALYGLCAYGLRLGEAMYLYKEHINRKDMIIEIKRTKHFTPKYMDRTKIDRYIPIGAILLEWIDEYLKVRPQGIDYDEPLIFLDNRVKNLAGRKKDGVKWERKGLKIKNYEQPLKHRDMDRDFKQFLIVAKLNPSYHPHHLRSSYITDRIEEGAKVHDVMIASGHTQSKNLDKYVRIKDKRAKIQKLNRDIL